METILTAMLFSGGRTALAHAGDFRAFRLRGGWLRPSTEDHTIDNLAATSACSGRCSPGTLDGRPDCPAGIGLRNLQARDRYLLRSEEPSRSQKTDHTFMC
jgi:PPM family protein phosphatase